jgi:hypothetical protein
MKIEHEMLEFHGVSGCICRKPNLSACDLRNPLGYLFDFGLPAMELAKGELKVDVQRGQGLLARPVGRCGAGRFGWAWHGGFLVCNSMP